MILTRNLASFIKGLIERQVKYSSNPLFKSFNSTKHSPLKFFNIYKKKFMKNSLNVFTYSNVKRNHHFYFLKLHR